MLSRRNFTVLMTAVLGPITVPLTACTNGQLDPQKIVDAIKNGCHIAVPLATIIAIINAAYGVTLQAIVDMVCSAYQSALQAKGLKGPLASGTEVEFVVTVTDKNGKQTSIPVKATVQ